ncbi:hypothetical protein ANN_13566 [Periplaneta americana]|uniref:Uncharacterized protein n=1 Tax=Periplaneta americana TaxID=6978 RepID=A0ABQ8TLS0_PERAM|nr:hypothetical protein ANN_13566 [Periplaneta americana]
MGPPTLPALSSHRQGDQAAQNPFQRPLTLFTKCHMCRNIQRFGAMHASSPEKTTKGKPICCIRYLPGLDLQTSLRLKHRIYIDTKTRTLFLTDSAINGKVRKNSPQYMFRNSSHSCHYRLYRTYRYCNETETLAHVLGSCQHGELLRNSLHHNIRKLIAQALRNKSFEVHEEVHCVASEDSGIKRADIVALDKTNSRGFILDPTVRFQMSRTQPSEVNKEKQQIYEPTIPYFREKYQMEGTWEVHGLMIGARGTIPRSTVNTIKTFGIHDIIPKISTSTIKGSVAILKNNLYGIS